MARVVCDTETWMPSRLSISSRTRLVLPAPEGAETMKRVPCGMVGIPVWQLDEAAWAVAEREVSHESSACCRGCSFPAAGYPNTFLRFSCMDDLKASSWASSL